jgi:oxygen-dependent protoporphyrinogen oxidase
MQPRAKGGWKIRVTGSEPDWLEADAVVLATPAHESARLTSNIDAFLAEDLSTIPYASCAVVALGYEVSQIGVPLDSFGFVVPLAEGRMILSCSFSSVKYTGRASEGRVLLRVFVGGACQSGLLRLPEEELVQLAERELAELMKIRGQPVLRHIKTHWQSMPQYHVGHLERVASIESRLKRFPDLVLAGSSLYGVGIPNCICSGRKAAEKIFCRINNSSDVAATS